MIKFQAVPEWARAGLLPQRPLKSQHGVLAAAAPRFPWGNCRWPRARAGKRPGAESRKAGRGP